MAESVCETKSQLFEFLDFIKNVKDPSETEIENFVKNEQETISNFKLRKNLYPFLQYISDEYDKYHNEVPTASEDEEKDNIELGYLNNVIKIASFFDYIEVNVDVLRDIQDWELSVDGLNYFSFLNRNFDENFYSEHIAALFDYNKVGEFSHLLFNQLGSHVKDWTEDKPFNVYREFCLKRWNSKNTIGKRRVDIVISGYKNVILIENKTLSSEHGNQTKDYLDTALNYYSNSKKCHGFFLTPTGCAASDSRYVRYSYYNLINDIYHVFSKIDSTNPNYLLIKNIVHELKENIAIPLKKYVLRAKEYRRKYGA